MQYQKRYTEVPPLPLPFPFYMLKTVTTWKMFYFSRVLCRACPMQKQSQVHKPSIHTASLRKWHAAHRLTRIFWDRKCLLSLWDAGVYATGKNGSKRPGKSFLVFLFKPVQRDRQCLANKCILNTHPGHVYTPFVNEIGNWEYSCVKACGLRQDTWVWAHRHEHRRAAVSTHRHTPRTEPWRDFTTAFPSVFCKIIKDLVRSETSQEQTFSPPQISPWNP